MQQALLDGFLVPAGGELSGFGFQLADSSGAQPGVLASSVLDTDGSTARRFLVMGMGGPLLITQGWGGPVSPYREDVVEWEVFLAFVAPWVAGCPTQVILAHCILATRDFCTRTRAWRITADAPPVSANVVGYPLPLYRAEPVNLERAAVDRTGHTTVLDARPPGDVGADLSAGSSAQQVGIGRDGQLLLVGGDPGSTVRLDLAVKPALNAPGLPRRLAGYIDTIMHGAISSLLLLPKQPWSDTTLASIKRGEFHDACNTIALRIEQGYTDATPRRRRRFL